MGGKRIQLGDQCRNAAHVRRPGVTVESHLFGFNENVGSGRMEVRFHARIRDEQKFSGADELRAQIARDIDAARKFFSERILAGNHSRE